MSNKVPLKVIPNVAVEPTSGPVGSKVILSGQDFKDVKPEDGAVFFGEQIATLAKWSERTIVVHVPFNAATGDVILRRNGEKRTVGHFTVSKSEVTNVSPLTGL